MKFFERYYLPLFAMIVLFAFVTRVYRLEIPPEYMFDEVYHALTAKLIARGDARAYEWWHPAIEPNTAVDWLHPPLAKYTQAFSMLVFGENSYGWRFSSVIFGVLVVVMTAMLAEEAFQNKGVALLAALLASLDGLLLVQSRIAMNDIHVTFFILLTLWCYLKFHRQKKLWWLFLTGLSAGLAMGSKWSGVFAVAIVWFFEVSQWFYDHAKTKITARQLVKFFGLRAVIIGCVPLLLYVLAYTQMFLQGKTLVCEGMAPLQSSCYCSQESSWWVTELKKLVPAQTARWEALEARGGCKRLVSHFSELHHQIWWYQTNLKATHPYQSRPWQWFLDLRPVWYYVKYEPDAIGNIYAFGNPALFWIGDVAVIGTAIVLVWKVSQKKKDKKNSFWKNLPLFSLGFLLVSYGAVWLPWQLSPRIMFFYHYTPAVPLLAIMLAFWLHRLADFFDRKGRMVSLAIVTVIAAAFVVWYPNWTGIVVPKDFADSIYFAVKNWK